MLRSSPQGWGYRLAGSKSRRSPYRRSRENGFRRWIRESPLCILKHYYVMWPYQCISSHTNPEWMIRTSLLTMHRKRFLCMWTWLFKWNPDDALITELVIGQCTDMNINDEMYWRQLWKRAVFEKRGKRLKLKIFVWLFILCSIDYVYDVFNCRTMNWTSVVVVVTEHLEVIGVVLMVTTKTMPSAFLS